MPGGQQMGIPLAIKLRKAIKKKKKTTTGSLVPLHHSLCVNSQTMPKQAEIL